MKTWFRLGSPSRSEAQHCSQSWEDGFVVCGDALTTLCLLASTREEKSVCKECAVILNA